MSQNADVHGAAVVTRGGSTVLELAGGSADAATGATCTPRTRFQVASVAKQFTAVAVLLLAERGTLRLDDPVARWLPDRAEQWRSVTVHQLLTHTSGVGHLGDFPDIDPFVVTDAVEVLATIQRAPLRTAPGAEWFYSSPGYVLLGWIVQHAGERPYPRFLAEEIFGPAGMAETTATHLAPADGVARGHRAGQPVPVLDMTLFPGAGDAWSTAGDLARFTAALRSGALVGADSLRLMLTRHTGLDGQRPADGWVTYGGYGYGCFLGTLGGQPAYFHSGDIPGCLTLNAWFRDGDTSVAVLLNEETTDMWALCRRLLQDAGSAT